MKLKLIACLLVLAAPLVHAPVGALAGENCSCRGNGVDIPEGQTVCLQMSGGSKLARCERVLNNTSWKILGNECPIAQLLTDRSQAKTAS